MIKHTALRPHENVQRINDGVRNVLQFERDFKLSSFGTEVDEQMAVIPGKFCILYLNVRYFMTSCFLTFLFFFYKLVF